MRIRTGKNLWGKIAKIIFGFAFIIFISLLSYFPSFNAPFQFDDLPAIVDNPYIKITNLMPSTLLRAGFQDRLHNRPLSNLSFAFNYYFGGLEPFGYHLVNFFLLIFTALGIWLVLFELFKKLGYERNRSALLSWLCALLWCVHPLNTQAITYIVQRHTALAGAFSIWSIYFYHLARTQKRSWLYFLLCALSAVIALTSKESALTLPLIIFFYKIYFFDELRWNRSNKLWLGFLAGFYLLGALLFLRPEMLAKLKSDFLKREFSPLERFISQPAILIWYLGLIIFPFPQFLSLEHGFSFFRSLSGYIWLGLGVIFILAVLTFAVRYAHRYRVFSFAVFWYFLVLLVEALPLPIDLASEHRLYLASLSIIAPLAGYLILRSRRPNLAFALLILVAFFWAGFTHQRNLVWKSKASLWKDAVLKAPTLSRPWNNYCSALVEEGFCFQAERICQKAIYLAPSSPQAYSSLGVCFLKKGDLSSAKKLFLKALELEPDYSPALFNLGMIYFKEKNWQEAEKWLKQLASPQSFYYLGIIEYRLDRTNEAISYFKKALEINPRSKEIAERLAKILQEQRNCRELFELAKSYPFLRQIFLGFAKSCQ